MASFSSDRKSIDGGPLLWKLAWSAYLLGAVWRALHLFFFHPPTGSIYADMAGYVGRARWLVDHPAIDKLGDVVHPPGGHMFLAFFLQFDSTWTMAIAAQWLISILVPIVLAAVGYELYGRKVALLALLISSLYFPFVHMAAFFMTESQFLLCNLLSLWLLLRAIRVRDARWAVASAFASGIVLGCAAALKPVILAASLLVFGWLCLAAGRHRSKRLAMVLLASAVGMAVIVIPLVQRATRLNYGRLCLISTNGAVNVLLGHYGHKRDFIFQDNLYACPTVYQHGYTENVRIPLSVTDSSGLVKYAWRWCRENPREALVISGEHVLDTFHKYPFWPGGFEAAWHNWAEIYQWGFELFILLPALVYVATHLRGLFRLDGAPLGDALLILPILGLMVTVFLTVGEPRFRIPFDGLLILLAVRCYTWGAARGDGLVLSRSAAVQAPPEDPSAAVPPPSAWEVQRWLSPEALPLWSNFKKYPLRYVFTVFLVGQAIYTSASTYDSPSWPCEQLCLRQAESLVHGSPALSVADRDAANYQGQHYAPLLPGSALVFVPLVALFGVQSVLAYLVGWALTAVNVWNLLGILKRLGIAAADQWWMILAFFFGTGYWFCLTYSFCAAYSVHLIFITFLLAALREAVGEARRLPLGLFLGMLVLTHPLGLCLAPFLLAVAWCGCGEEAPRAERFRTLGVTLLFAAPFAICAMLFNYLRFDDPFELGYSYTLLGNAELGLLSFGYLPRNLYYLLLQGFALQFRGPGGLSGVEPNTLGTSLLHASPFLLLAFLARWRRTLLAGAWVSITLSLLAIGCCCIVGFLQYNCQRYALYIMPLLFVLVALGYRTRAEASDARLWKGLICWSVALNVAVIGMLPTLNWFIIQIVQSNGGR